MNERYLNANRELEKALRLRDRFGQALPGDPGLDQLVDTYRDLIRKTDSMMRDSGVAEACSRCAAETGSCCFRGMEEGYGALSFYVNLLMGSDLSWNVEFPDSCPFVGVNGCRLEARHSFCLNYFCPGLRETLGEQEIRRIQHVIGEQLIAGWELERALVRWIADAQKQA